MIDCIPHYSEAGHPPLTSRPHLGQGDMDMKIWAKSKSLTTGDGRLDAAAVSRKLQKVGISKSTQFLAWATWGFDLSCVRTSWLSDEGAPDILPQDQMICLVLKEFVLTFARPSPKNVSEVAPFPWYSP